MVIETIETKPKTAQQYWQAIEGFGRLVFEGKHNLVGETSLVLRGSSNASELLRDEKLPARVAKEMEYATGQLHNLVDEVCARFNLAHPKKAFQEGKISYGDWYEEQRKLSRGGEWENLICSACPLNEGPESFINPGYISCRQFRGVLFGLRSPAECAVVGVGDLTKAELYRAILSTDGHYSLNRFTLKQKTLRASNHHNS